MNIPVVNDLKIIHIFGGLPAGEKLFNQDLYYMLSFFLNIVLFLSHKLSHMLSYHLQLCICPHITFG